MAGIFMPYISAMGQQGYVTPNQIPNLSLWYNASASSTTVNNVATNNFQGAVVNGSSISKWVDLQAVGGDANVTGGAGKQPTYTIPIQNGLGSVTYNSANSNNLDINPIGSWAKLQSGFTIYSVLKITSLPAANKQIVVTDANLGHQWSGTYWQVGAAGGLATAQSTTVSTSAWTMHGMIFDGSFTNANQTTQNNGRLKYRYNKTGQALTFSANPGTQTSNAATVMYIGGNNRNAPTSYMDGYIGEILIWTRALTTVEISNVEYYLNQKWGLGL